MSTLGAIRTHSGVCQKWTDEWTGLLWLLLLSYFRAVVSGRNILTAPRAHFWTVLILWCLNVFEIKRRRRWWYSYNYNFRQTGLAACRFICRTKQWVFSLDLKDASESAATKFCSITNPFAARNSLVRDLIIKSSKNNFNVVHDHNLKAEKCPLRVFLSFG